MLPWGHLAFGYVCYSGLSRWVSRRRPDGSSLALVALGTQLPDLVDKPLAWTFGVLPSGRSLAHSAFTATFASTVVWDFCRRRGRSELGVAFAVGYASHLVADSYRALLSGRYAALSSLGWPLLPPPRFDHEGGIVDHFRGLSFTPAFAFQLVLVALAAVVWVADGAPGRSAVGDRLARVVDRARERERAIR
ncbi:metal-dependent hydrolase [Halococcus salsus]|uniref:metal-dependent hydrolase n=1 Tax=Halococcus salsus TaxID=2162894 RepID=UPI00135840F7|nr:metal-dependent hydrolase [Halococcus salsus]